MVLVLRKLGFLTALPEVNKDPVQNEINIIKETAKKAKIQSRTLFTYLSMPKLENVQTHDLMEVLRISVSAFCENFSDQIIATHLTDIINRQLQKRIQGQPDDPLSTVKEILKDLNVMGVSQFVQVLRKDFLSRINSTKVKVPVAGCSCETDPDC